MRRASVLVFCAACRFGFDDSAVSAIGDGGNRDNRGADDDAQGGDGSGTDTGVNPNDPLLVLYFDFDEASGGTATNRGTFPLATVTVAGQQGVAGMVNGAIRFADAADGLEIPDDALLDGFAGLTIEAWIYYDAFNALDYSTILKKDGAYILRTCDANSCSPGNSNVVSAIIWGSNNVQAAAGATETMSTATWYHIAMTYDGTNARAYWNGSFAAMSPSASGLYDSAGPITIGRQVTSGENLSGRLDELRLWKTVRTDEEICVSANRTWTGTACQ